MLAGLFLTSWLYSRGVERLWDRAGAGRGVRRGEAISFSAGMLVLGVALVSPLDRVAEALFAAHMLQHLLLMTVAAPLLVLGAPQAGLAWGLPPSGQQLWRSLHPLRRWIGALASPAPALLLHSVALWAWHLPPAYDAALRLRAVHAAEHASFLGTALLFWWSVLHRRGGLRRAPGLGVLALFAMSMQGAALGFLLFVSTAPWYAAHLTTAPAWGITPLDDQHLAGLLMWVPGALPYLVAAGWCLAGWLREAHPAPVSGDPPLPQAG